MKRGVVMSIHKQHAVVMTADGQFLQALIQETAQIGEEITFEEEYKKPRTFKTAYWYSSAAAVILLLFLPLLFFMQRDAHPVVAYMSMDINPSVELGVDENRKVRELRAINEDGELIIKGLNYEGISAEMVAASILERARVSHYLDTPNKDIFIASVMLDDNSAHKIDFEDILTQKVGQTLQGILTQLAAEAASANITTLSVPNELREEAAANGISSGKMAVYLMAKDEGYNLELKQLKLQSIDKVTESLGGVKTIVGNAEDTSKEKLKELVVREKEEKAKLKVNKKTNASTATTAPKTNKPVKAVKPEKPAVNGVNKAAETDKPAITPGKSNKPSGPNRPNDVKKTDKDKDKYKEFNGDRLNNDDEADDDDNQGGNWNPDDDNVRENNVSDDTNSDDKNKDTKQDNGKKKDRNDTESDNN